MHIISEMNKAAEKATILIEALPYIRQFRGAFIVVKLGGSAQDNPDFLRRIFADVDFLSAVGMRPIIVYGGGKRITEAMKKLGKQATFIAGQRVTDRDTLAVAERTLCNDVGNDLLRLLEEAGGHGILLNGRDHSILRAIPKQLPGEPENALGFVGEPVALFSAPLYEAFTHDPIRIPLIAPIACGCGQDSQTLYNVNGDTAAAQIARDLSAEKLVFLSDIPGVCRDPKDPHTLISTVTKADVNDLKEQKVISGGMIPKVDACLFGLEGGVQKEHIVSGELPHALLLEIFTNTGIGTQLTL